MPDSNAGRRQGEKGGGEGGKGLEREGGFLFGYGDAALLVILFGYLAECFPVNATSNKDIDMYVFLKGVPILLTAFVLAIKGKKSPGSLVVYLLGAAYFLLFLLVLAVRVIH